MKQSHAQDAKYNIAWFKIAEYVSRGEKERALGIYRLLSHSINDRACAQQLEGDILLTFQDTQGAVTKYFAAAQLYQQENRILQAAAIYEHLHILMPDSLEYMQSLVELYAMLDLKNKFEQYFQKLCQNFLQQGKEQEFQTFLDRLHDIDTGYYQLACEYSGK